MTSRIHSSSSFSDATSFCSDAARSLSLENRERLGILLEQYLLGLEAGLPRSVEDLTREAPELAEPLTNCVSGLLALHAMAADLGADALHASADRPNSDVASSSEGGLRVLGDFEIHEELGRGGMGVVYRATQRSLRRTVAIKLLPFVGAMNASQIKRFQNEAECAASLNHPNIVPVYAFGLKDGIHYYAMQWIDGLSLEEWIASRRSIDDEGEQWQASDWHSDWQEVVRLGIQAAAGLHAAHEAGVIHRDVKPSNLLVDKSGKLWLTDFGLARVPSNFSLTRSGDVIGTMKYMSPEQASGKSDLVDGRSDVFSLGITLHEMLTLGIENDAISRGPIVLDSPSERIQPLRKLRPDLPPDLGAVIAKGTSVCPEDRYESAKHFAEDLSRVLRCERTLARPPSPIDHAFEWWMRHRARILIATLATPLVIAGAMVMRTRLLNEARTHDERFLTSATDQHALRNNLATTIGKMGVMQLESMLLESSSPGSAIQTLQESERLFADLAEKQPASYDRLLQWSISENNLARALQLDGQIVPAAQLYTNALGHLRTIHKDATLDVRLQMAATENNLGLLLAESNSNDEAIKYFEHAVQLLERVEPASELMGSVQLNLASILASDAPHRAIDCAELSYRIFSDGLEIKPGNIHRGTQSAHALNVLGTAQLQLDRTDEAIASLRKSVHLIQSLLKIQPERIGLHQNLAISWNHLGLAYASANDANHAREAWEQAVEHQRIAVRTFPDDAEAQHVMAHVLHHLGNLEKSLQRRDAARSAFAESIEHQKRAVASGPNAQRYRDTLTKYEEELNAW